MLVATVLLAAIAAADTVVWAIACHRLDDGVRATVASAGWTLSADPARWRGWPVAAEIVLPNATLRSGPAIVPPLAWTAGTQTFRLAALSPTRLVVSAAGPQTIALADAPPIPFTARSLRATLDLAERDPPRLLADDLDIASSAGPVRIASTRLDIQPGSLTLTLDTLSLPDASQQDAGHRRIEPPIDTLHLTAHLSSPIVPMPTTSESARNWRAGGGRLLLDDAVLHWGPLAATGTATLALDPQLQPILTGRITATGQLAALDRLVDTGAITASGALAMRGMLAILSAPTGTGPLTLPIQLEGGIVSLARIPLLRLAPIQWD